MKKKQQHIIGIFLVIATLLSAKTANADEMCNPNDINTSYEEVYCNIRLNDNESADGELVEILAKQFAMNEVLIKEILANNICEYAKRAEEPSDLPQSIKDACLPSGKTTEEVVGAWTIFTDIRNQYEKEKTILFNKKSLEFKFKASEQYWDGKISGGKVPFDLVMDLNLIEKILFGSKAQWMNDVFAFPKDGGESEEVKTDNNLSPEGEIEETNFEDTKDTGVSVVKNEETGEGALPPGCVPLPNSNVEDSPFYNSGGQLSGLQCIDPDSIIFKTPESAGAGQSENEPENGCPAGSIPGGLAGLVGVGAGQPQPVQQSPEYPGPFLGGTLKQFPQSTRPACGAGESILDLNQKESVCIPTSLCGDLNAARNHLFGEDWEDDPDIVDVARSIEVLACIDVIQHNRPQSPYSLIEGCIDCHIIAMVDALEEALSTNVTPLQNTTSAFATSSPFSPNFSFNLNIALKPKIKFQTKRVIEGAIEKTKEKDEKALKDSTPQEPTVVFPESPLENIERKTAQAERIQQEVLQSTRNFKLSSDAISDQEFSSRVEPLFEQMRDSFQRIQSIYEGIISSTALDQKQQCVL